MRAIFHMGLQIHLKKYFALIVLFEFGRLSSFLQKKAKMSPNTFFLFRLFYKRVTPLESSNQKHFACIFKSPINLFSLWLVLSPTIFFYRF